MDPNLLKQVNRLWRKIYPYLASQIMERYQRDSGAVLELGPFSGGISVEMARRYPGLDITIADESSQVLEGFKAEIRAEGFSDVIDIRKSVLDPLVFGNSEFGISGRPIEHERPT